MTNSEARQILIDYTPSAKDIGLAIDAAIAALSSKNILTTDKIIESNALTSAYLSGFDDGKRSKSSITQAIRDAAVNGPQFLGDVESQIIEAFCKHSFEHSEFSDDLFFGATNKKYDARTFMLLVAEALES